MTRGSSSRKRAEKVRLSLPEGLRETGFMYIEDTTPPAVRKTTFSGKYTLPGTTERIVTGLNFSPFTLEPLTSYHSRELVQTLEERSKESASCTTSRSISIGISEAENIVSSTTFLPTLYSIERESLLSSMTDTLPPPGVVVEDMPLSVSTAPATESTAMPSDLRLRISYASAALLSATRNLLPTRHFDIGCEVIRAPSNSSSVLRESRLSSRDILIVLVPSIPVLHALNTYKQLNKSTIRAITRYCLNKVIHKIN